MSAATTEPRSAPRLLGWRAWRGQLAGPSAGVLVVARSSLAMLLRRKLFWALYACGLLVFLLYFFGQYLFVWIEDHAADISPVRVGVGGGNRMTVRPAEVVTLLREHAKFDGSPETFRNFIELESSLVVVVLALAGSILVGNDFRFNSLAFYLSKPLGKWHYVLGKCLAVGLFVNLMTTLPALVLLAEYLMLRPGERLADRALSGLGVVGYGALQTVVLSLSVVALGAWLRRTVPLAAVWAGVFLAGRAVGQSLVGELHLSPLWRLFDLWNSLDLLGCWMMRVPPAPKQPLPGWLTFSADQPPLALAALSLAAVCVACLALLSNRIRAVEVVS
jgi:ABC-type transport system involved in multi-copper enzyme maturation permease subunit